MSKNLLLLQDGFPGSNTNGTEVTSLDIKNFFKYEKNVTSTSYSRVHTGELGTNYDITKHYAEHDTFSKLCRDLQYYEPDTGEYKPNTAFKHYSMLPFLFAVRMKKGFLGTDVTIMSRLNNENLKLRFYDIGNTVDDFKAIYNELPARTWSVWGSSYCRGYKFLTDSIVIPSLDQYNHCFLGVLFSDTAYNLESGTVLLNNEPLLNISWTETEFVEAQ